MRDFCHRYGRVFAQKVVFAVRAHTCIYYFQITEEQK